VTGFQEVRVYVMFIVRVRRQVKYLATMRKRVQKNTSGADPDDFYGNQCPGP
jgi:hypothetical protein